MSVAIKKESLKSGQGVYTQSDISRILNLPYSKVSYWIKHYFKKALQDDNSYQYYFSTDNHLTVNFYALVEIYIFNALREFKIPTKKILESHNNLSKIYNTPYPFAFKDMILNGRDIFFDKSNQLITADKLQYSFTEFIRPFAKKLKFDSNKMAAMLYPLGMDKSVVVDPKIQFGSPIIKGTRIDTQTIFQLHKGGETEEFIAEIYNLTLSKVQDAIEFHSKAA